MERNCSHCLATFYCYCSSKANKTQYFLIKVHFLFLSKFGMFGIYECCESQHELIDCRICCRTEFVYNYLGGGEGDNTGELGV